MTNEKKSSNLELYYVCPMCGAYTALGSDVDMQIFCSNCFKSFSSSKAQSTLVDRDIIQSEYIRIVSRNIGWISYVKRPEC